MVIGSAEYYRRTFSSTFRESLRCAFVDMRTFTPSAEARSDGAYDMDVVADDIEQARQALGFDSMVIVGHSMQALMALEYARRYPERVSHVVMVGMAPVWGDETEHGENAFWTSDASPERRRVHEERRERLSAAADTLTPGERVVHHYVMDSAFYWYEPAYEAGWLWEGVQLNMERYRQFVDTSIRGYDITKGPDVTTPVFVAVGRYDYVAPHVLWNDRTRAPLQDLSFHLFMKSGHTPQLEEPELFDRKLLGWLGRSTVASSGRAG